jgi:hydrogenase/urease accessory protein HupE
MTPAARVEVMLALLLGSLCAATWAPDAGASMAHPGSISRSRLLVRGDSVRLELRCQALSVLEVLPADLDGNASLSADELAAVADRLGAYVSEHYRLTADGGGEPLQGRLLPGELVGLVLDEPLVGSPASEQWIELQLDHHAEAPISDLLVQVTLFLESNPEHRDVCELVWNDEPPRERVFTAQDGTSLARAGGSAAPARRAALEWVRLGVEHILTGWDHLAFVLALIVASATLRSLLWVVTAFTLAHSLTLALAALEVVSAPGRPVEMCIALSIGWMGATNLLARRPRSRWPEAFVFGLVHGLGFAGFLGEALSDEPRRLLPLAGFNLGVELGQLAVVAMVVAPLLLWRRVVLPGAREPAQDGRWLAPAALRRLASAVVLLAGLYWFAGRAGWIA